MLRRIIAAAFALAALIMPVGATSAIAGEYGPDEYPCTIELPNGVVEEGSTVTATVTCTEDTTGTIILTADDGASDDAAGADTAGTTFAAGESAGFAGANVAAAAVRTALFVGADMAATTRSALSAVVHRSVADSDTIDSADLDVAAGETAMFTISDLAPGDYTIRVVDEDWEDLADPASLTVTAMPSDHDGWTPGAGELAATGATGVPYLAVAGGLLVAGIAALVVTRRARKKV
ncbi:hypothetical protein GCM10028784_30910 [Myceligenerans cantabricum]